MTNYVYADDAAPPFPKGTVIHVSAWYDNTRANKNNPIPISGSVRRSTVDEMAHAWMNVVYLTDEEYKALLAERKAKLAKGRTIRTKLDSAPPAAACPRFFSAGTGDIGWPRWATT